jgi:D-threo-aldose 1-dehydrogenase
MSGRQHTLGFGTAGLYGLPGKRDRCTLLDSAYAMGIRHLDVAPMYGLGRAEGEVGEFLRSHPDVTVATKFGIRPTVLGAVAGLVQPPVRRVLQASASVKAKVKQSGRRGDSGVVGRLLYSPPDYSVASARRGLHDSLKALRTDHIDYFLVHEPVGAFGPGGADLIDFLEGQRRLGTIGSWGPAGDLAGVEPNLENFTASAPVVQHSYDIVSGHRGPGPGPGRQCITFGFIGGPLATAREVFDRDPQLRRRCSDLLDADAGDGATLVGLLVRDALRANASGTLLLSSTSAAHLRAAASATEAALPNEVDVIAMLAARLRNTGVTL